MRIVILSLLLSLVAIASGQAQIRVSARVGVHLPVVSAHVTVGSPRYVRHVRHGAYRRHHGRRLHRGHGRGVRRVKHHRVYRRPIRYVYGYGHR